MMALRIEEVIFLITVAYVFKDKDKDTFIGPQEFVVHMTI